MSIKKGNFPMAQTRLPSIIVKKHNIVKSVTPLYKEDIVYQSHYGDFLRLKDPAERVSVFNRLNLITMKSHTVAQLTSSGKVVWEKTSEYITNIIGQDNYDIVFSSLCSVISQEFKVRAILALLTEPKKSVEKQPQSSQTDLSEIKTMVDSAVQTENSFDVVKKPPPKRSKRQVVPYVVTESSPPEKVSKVVVYPENFDCFKEVTVKSETVDTMVSQVDFLNSEHDSEHFDLLKCDENSTDSIGNLSIVTTDELMNAPLSIVDRMTEKNSSISTKVTLLDGTVLSIPCKIEDDFHVATPEILRLVPPESRRKLLWYQAYTDWKYCLTRDDDDNLPIHLAVLNDDVHLLRRQCLVLKTRNESIDTTNGDDLTALQMAILANSPLCTALLIQLGASPLVADEEYRTCFHLAAEAGALHLIPLLDKCKEDPLTILRSSEELWKSDLATMSKEYQVKYLLHKVCTMFDSQGYTPLMLASKLGKHDAVEVLVKAAPSSVDYKATSSGATALYLAVGAACMDSAQRGNKSKVFDDFKKTIEHLVEAGADPNISNFSGSDVTALLADSDNSELSMYIATKRTAVNCKNITKDDQPFMIVKENDGTLMNVKDQMKKAKDINKIKDQLKKEVKGKLIKTNKNKPEVSKQEFKGKSIQKKDKPVIIENKVIKPNEYINTYRNFIDKINQPVAPEKVSSLKILKIEPKPSTSKSEEDTSHIDIKTEIVDINIDCSDNFNSIEKPNEVKTNNEDPLAIKTEKDEMSPEENTGTCPTIRVSKRKIIRTAKSLALDSEPKSATVKKKKIQDEVEVEKI